jgi:hypothetical protein
VAITLRDGRVLHRDTFVVRGDAANPAPASELRAKFLSLASPALGDERAANVVDLVDHLHELADIRELTANARGSREGGCQ